MAISIGVVIEKTYIKGVHHKEFHRIALFPIIIMSIFNNLQ